MRGACQFQGDEMSVQVQFTLQAENNLCYAKMSLRPELIGTLMFMMNE